MGFVDLEILNWGIDLLLGIFNEVGIPVITFLIGLATPFLVKMKANHKESKILREHYIDTLNSILPEIDGKIEGIEKMIEEFDNLRGLQPPSLMYHSSTHTIVDSFNPQKVYELFSNHSYLTSPKQKGAIIRIQKVTIFLSAFDSLIPIKYKEMAEAIQRVNDDWNRTRENFHKVKAQLIVSGDETLVHDDVLMHVNDMYKQWAKSKDPKTLSVNLAFFHSLHEFIYPHYSNNGRNDLLPLIEVCQDFFIQHMIFNSIVEQYRSIFTSSLESLRMSTDGYRQMIGILERTRVKPWYRMPFT